jgi:hypothetical protein
MTTTMYPAGERDPFIRIQALHLMQDRQEIKLKETLRAEREGLVRQGLPTEVIETRIGHLEAAIRAKADELARKYFVS